MKRCGKKGSMSPGTPLNAPLVGDAYKILRNFCNYNPFEMHGIKSIFSFRGEISYQKQKNSTLLRNKICTTMLATLLLHLDSNFCCRFKILITRSGKIVGAFCSYRVIQNIVFFLPRIFSISMYHI